MRIVLALILSLPLGALAAADLAVVKYSKGGVRTSVGADSAVLRDLKQSDMVQSGSRVETGEEGKAVLRFLSDQSFLEARPKAVFRIKRVKVLEKRVRKVVVDAGEVILGVKKKNSNLQCENINTVVSGKSRYSFSSNEKQTATIVVLDGEITVQNRAKDVTVPVRAGQKAVSDENGVRVFDAADSELEQVGFRQNVLELDFMNPQTEEFTTLEVEYETDF